MNCFICGSNDWENVDQFRLKREDDKANPTGMSLCKSCGIVSYPAKYQSKEALKEFYKKSSYRKPPQVNDFFSGERKLHYHHYFLNSLFTEWKKQGLTSPVIGEVGSAFGMFLNWVKEHHFPSATVKGTEWDLARRRVAYHEYGLTLDEELDTSVKYDLITSYRVLEHQCDPDKELKLYHSLLKDDGILYLSVPVWFRELQNPGQSVFDIEFYWSTSHINCWSNEHLEYLIAREGFEVIYRNDNIYGNTYLLRKLKDWALPAVPIWSPDDRKKDLERIYNCWMALHEGDAALALEQWKNCVAAWAHHYEYNRAKFHEKGFEVIHNDFILKAIEACPNSADAFTLASNLCMRYNQWDLALKYLKHAIDRKPNNPSILAEIAKAFREKAIASKDAKEQADFYKEAAAICKFIRQSSMELAPQAVTFVYSDQSKIPMPSESP